MGWRIFGCACVLSPAIMARRRATNRVDPKDPTKGYNFFPATFAPPVIRSLKVNYSLSQAAAPEAVQTFNDFVYEDVTPTNNDQDQSFAPFRATEDVRPTFYLSFTLPPDRVTFPNRTLSSSATPPRSNTANAPCRCRQSAAHTFGAPASVVTPYICRDQCRSSAGQMHLPHSWHAAGSPR